MEPATPRGRLRWTQRNSYAPTAWIDVPDAPEGCTLHLLYTLPPSTFFDPFTARPSLPVRDVHVLGPVNLENMPGWATEPRLASQIENAPPTWWESAPKSRAPCTGAECEHTALLLDLAQGGEVRVPLHVRYARATFTDTRVTTVPKGHAWLDRAADAWQRALAPWLATPTAPQALLADAPIALSVCAPHAPAGGDVMDTTALLPPSHAHWHTQLQALLGTSTVHAQRIALPHETSAAIPVGDAALAAPVLLTTIAAVWLATLWLIRCVWRAI
ncbi:hypothetical protein MCAP1_002796 [Malassezia caprae]|uniref:Protein PBN1 n=1 Tax=Malassezia caprae TaxID=1381934 RepID=A0AAF0E934_9BASI|nr:hypothetical protein MCAP1_002796 [Malassezia caprae]